ncbi:MAG: NAD(P)-dependent oxidoreductase [Pelagibacterales bacterium]|nr:NAD(P)-dependent oxidoreductase [Pelagibacterales bacterium]
MTHSIKTVGFIGTGLMGLPMAKNILAKKFKLNVWNRTSGKTLELKKKGAKVFSDIKDLVQNSKVIVSMLANDDVCKAVLIKKIQPYLKKGQIVIDMSSTTQTTALQIGSALKKKKVFFLDAPVSGGTIGAEKGTLAIMAGGDKKIFNIVMPLFKSMGTAIYVGKTGCGQVAKLANQTIVGISIGAVSEALILAEAAGADPKAVREIMLQGFAGGPILKNHGLRILTKNFKPGGKASTQLKDMNNIISTAKKYKLNLPIAKKVQELYAKTVKSGRANLDHSALYLYIKSLI